MEADLRLMLLSLGVIFLVWIVVDAYRRRPQVNQPQPKEALIEVPKEQVAEDYRPSAHEGVIGKPRKVGTSGTISFQAPPPAPSASSHQSTVAPKARSPVRKKARFKHEKVDHKPIGLVIVSADHNGFEGSKLHAAIEREKLLWDEQGIYHRHQNNNVNSERLFTLAQTGQPGTFSTASRYNQRIQAIVLIQDAPGNHISQEGLEDLLLTAHALAKGMAGKICRLDGKKLDLPDIDEMKKQVSSRLNTVMA
ncbi:MAG: hypothetical protein CMF48_02265 [Legionellales bacterium]|nr:hypothetical protein [Legionellales bacterium]|tara:strand:+ start:162 stop:914 length:753 start_codon:yes stop_codon:yes gene_type:complete